MPQERMTEARLQQLMAALKTPQQFVDVAVFREVLEELKRERQKT